MKVSVTAVVPESMKIRVTAEMTIAEADAIREAIVKKMFHSLTDDLGEALRLAVARARESYIGTAKDGAKQSALGSESQP